VLILLAGGITWGIMASRPGRPEWQPASITNLVLLEGPESVTTGTDYHPIATRAEDPALLNTADTAELARIFHGTDSMQVGRACAGVVTGAAVVQALKTAGCSQVLRLITTATGTGRCVVLVDIFNLAGGPSLVAAARAFGEEPSGAVDAFPSQPPNAAPAGFIRPWQGTKAAGIARAAGNAADVDAFGHFLVVVWTYSTGNGGSDDAAAQLANGATEILLSQWADDRAAHALGS
jgi:hypothetical protein